MERLREFGNRIAALFGRRRFDDAFDEEMRLHIEERADEVAAQGMPRSDALAQARREFGGAVRIAEASREAWRWTWMEDLARDLRYAARSLAREPGFALTAIASLALGIGVNTAIFSAAAEVLLSRPSVRDPGTLVHVETRRSGLPAMREYRFLEDAKVFDGLAGSAEMQEVNWRDGDTSRRLFTTRVTSNFFDVTGAPLARGRSFAKDEREVAVISDGYWRSRLNGDPGVLGRVLVLDGRPYTIVGVLPAVHRTLTGFGYVPDMYLPLESDSLRFSLYGRVPAGMSRKTVLERLRAACAELDRVYPDPYRRWTRDPKLGGLAAIERAGDRIISTLTVFFAMLLGVAALMLLIACVNVAGLLLGRASTRAQEFAIRMSIGAGRGRLIRQLLAESLLLSMLGACAGLILNLALTRVINAIPFPTPFPLRLAIEPDTRLLLYAASIAVACAAMTGLLPALQSTRAGVAVWLKGDERQVSGRGAPLRAVLVGGQLTVSVLVLVMAALAVRNLIESSALDPGFDLRATLWAQVRMLPGKYPTSEKVRAAVAGTLGRLRSIAGVETATVAVFVPLNDHFASRVLTLYSDGSERGVRLEHSWNAVGPDYLKTMGIGLVAGREFTEADREGGQRVAIVNEALARVVFGAANPLGRRIRFGQDDAIGRTVVGIARNSKYSTLGEKDRPALYESYFQAGSPRPAINYLLSTASSPEAAIKPLAAALYSADPSATVDARPMSQAMGFALMPSRAGAVALGAVGVLGLLLASVGLYGVLSYSTSRRTREIGLRMALGAGRAQVLGLALSEGVWVAGCGLAAGMALSLWITRPLATFLVPGLAITDPAAYMSVALVLLIVGGAASVIPALRALRVDPMTALRHD